MLSNQTPFAIGKGIVQNMDNLLVSMTDVQKTSITVRGVGELYIE